jgi:hypothetical protein
VRLERIQVEILASAAGEDGDRARKQQEQGQKAFRAGHPVSDAA